MKVLLILASQAYKLRYEESGYPTKADYGEFDNSVAYVPDREVLEKEKKWVNPLSIADDGTDDD